MIHIDLHEGTPGVVPAVVHSGTSRAGLFVEVLHFRSLNKPFDFQSGQCRVDRSSGRGKTIIQ